jgi:hypothetical protein
MLRVLLASVLLMPFAQAAWAEDLDVGGGFGNDGSFGELPEFDPSDLPDFKPPDTGAAVPPPGVDDPPSEPTISGPVDIDLPPDLPVEDPVITSQTTPVSQGIANQTSEGAEALTRAHIVEIKDMCSRLPDSSKYDICLQMALVN